MNETDDLLGPRPAQPNAIDRAIGFFLENGLVALLLAGFLALAGLAVAPFAWDLPWLVRDPVPVDAIPDTGDNQQVVFTEWAGRSPQDVEDQITYPLTVALLGVPGVQTIRSSSMFGFSSIFVIFDDDIEFYWSRSRLLEKLASLPGGTLPTGVEPALGPDATALGQVFWYTLEGRDENGAPAGGWDLHELRSVQDWYVRFALASVEGVAEVASIGGYVKEYQIDVDPAALAAHGVSLRDVFQAVAASNVDVGARTIELNRAEYVVRGLGLLEGLDDIEATVVGVKDDVPITVGRIGTVSIGPALRRGALDKGGAEAVGGVVVARYGANPLAVIGRVKAKLAEIAPGLPAKVLDDGRSSRVTVVPFYDRTGLIHETLDTLGSALELQLCVTAIVVLVMVGHFGSAVLVALLLPLAVLGTFVAMKLVGVDANVVALTGIAIAIGTMADVGIVLTESIREHVQPGERGRARAASVFRGASDVGGAVMTAVLTTVVGFLPVFALEGAEGKLFAPLAWTKTFALVVSIVVALLVVPAAARWLLGRPAERHASRNRLALGRAASFACALVLVVWLARRWQPLGPEHGLSNLVFTTAILGSVLLLFWLVVVTYEPLLRWCLRHKALFLTFPLLIVVAGLTCWLGFERVFGPTVAAPIEAVFGDAADVRATRAWRGAAQRFPGLGREFMPPLDEGSFLLMPVAMAHASLGEAFDLLQQQDRRIRAIPEVEDVVGKIGRVESPLDPAPISMIETVITYRPEYTTDAEGAQVRQWRDEIKEPRDIWNEIERAAALPGLTTASMLQPIETRRLMLQTGMRAALGVKLQGPDLATLERVALEVEEHLRQVPSIRPETVFADRLVAKPYLEIDIDREAIARYGLSVRDVQDVIEVAIGGRRLTTTVEGRERYPVRVRYQRELRDRIEELGDIFVPVRTGAQVPLGQLADIRYAPGPQNIKSEDTFLVAYVLFEGRPGQAEVDVVEDAREHLTHLLEFGDWSLPPGVSYRFAGTYESQQRAAAKLRVVLPMALFVIFLLLYLSLRSVTTTLIVFSAVFVAWAGGFGLLWLYGEEWFLRATPFGIDLRALFDVHTINLSVAVWVGFLALFGIATDDGVLMATYLRKSFAAQRPDTVAGVRDAVVAAGLRRVRPCLMTTATTILALVPVLTATGRGSDVMLPMAIPSVGGMAVALVTIFVVPTLVCLVEELRLAYAARSERRAAGH